MIRRLHGQSLVFFDQKRHVPIGQTFVNMVDTKAHAMPQEMKVIVSANPSRADRVQRHAAAGNDGDCFIKRCTRGLGAARRCRRHAAGDTLPVIYAGMFIILLLRKIQVWQNGTQIVIIDNRSWTECSK